MVIRKVKILDDAIDSDKIAADVVVAADIATGGVSSAELQSTCVTNSELARTAHQSGIATDISAAAAGTVVEFPTNFTTTPNVVVTPFTSGTTSIQVNVDSASTASFKIYTDTSGTYTWYASVQPTG